MKLVRRVYFVFALFTVLGFAGLPAAAQSDRTFYIDYASGSNSNPGTQAAPWKTHPYMQASSACTGVGSAPSYSHQAGDQFIFKGGVSWPAACFQMTIQAGGTSSAVDYYGVDKAWYNGGSFTRPLFDFNFQFAASGSRAIQGSVNYMTIDNIEIAHQNFHTSTSDPLQGVAIDITCGTFCVTTGTTVKNTYIHDWVSTDNWSSANGMGYGALHGIALVDTVETSGLNSYAFVGGVKQTQVWGGGCNYCGEVRNSHFHDGWMGCFSVKSCHDNEFNGIEQDGIAGTVGNHTQIIEDDCTQNQCTFSVYNNAIHDSHAGVNISIDYNTNTYNNVMWNLSNNNYIMLQQCGDGFSNCDNSSFVGYIYNNTMDVSIPGAANCFAWESKSPKGLGTINLQNNVCIGSNQFGSVNVATTKQSKNYSMTTSEADTYGFTSNRKYAPSSADPNVAGQGVNLLSFATGSLAALASDTAGAPWYGSSYRQRSSTWDLGAYVVSAQSPSSSKPNPPSNLSAIVQ